MAGNNNENGKGPMKSGLTTFWLWWFLGFFGLHRFYAGKIASGALICYWTIVSILITSLNGYLGIACFVGVGAVVVNDFVLIAMKKFKDCYGREIVDDRL